MALVLEQKFSSKKGDNHIFHANSWYSVMSSLSSRIAEALALQISYIFSLYILFSRIYCFLNNLIPIVYMAS